jgi:predicted metal-dependent hydrolase
VTSRLQKRPEPAYTLPKQTRANYLKYKESARILIHERLRHFNKFYNFRYNKVFVKDTTSRWGSCSKAGNLNFSYRLVLLPQELADYVIVHELCHLEQFNHSQKFWDLVAQQVPEYKKIRSQLRGGLVS